MKRYHVMYVKNNVFECCHWQLVFNPCFAQQETVAAKDGLNKLETDFERNESRFLSGLLKIRGPLNTKPCCGIYLSRFVCDGNVQWRREIREKWEQIAHHNQGSGPFTGPVVDISKQINR
uniref:Expressed protein n=1 Tax=Echinococcus granulosus TaxID=6210 RepID=A0A068WM68_ECHGR|nr:expressed protein [Echinococcus granulosus]